MVQKLNWHDRWKNCYSPKTESTNRIYVCWQRARFFWFGLSSCSFSTLANFVEEVEISSHHHSIRLEILHRYWSSHLSRSPQILWVQRRVRIHPLSKCFSIRRSWFDTGSCVGPPSVVNMMNDKNWLQTENRLHFFFRFPKISSPPCGRLVSPWDSK